MLKKFVKHGHAPYGPYRLSALSASSTSDVGSNYLPTIFGRANSASHIFQLNAFGNAYKF